LIKEIEKWRDDRERQKRREGKKFHDIEWEAGETIEWLGELFNVAGLGRLTGERRTPLRLGREVRWAVEHLRKYPEPGKGKGKGGEKGGVEWEEEEEEKERSGGDEKWLVVERGERKDLLAFI